jgi:hypothetical protein
MGCTEIDVRDYFFGELPEAEGHITACADCTAALGQLRATRTALLTLREEEPPQRIGFVSDKIFQPSPVRRFFASFWLSGARLGFASAAMLSVALLVFSIRPQPPKVVQVAAQQVDVNAVVAKAVSAAMLEQEKKTHLLLEAADRKHQEKEDALALRVAEYTTNLDKTLAMNNKLMSISYNGEAQ